MIRATLETEQVQQMEEGELHKWLTGKGFNTANLIKRTEIDVSRDRLPGTGDGKVTLFEQFPCPSFKLRLFTPELREMGVLDPPSPTDPNFQEYER